MNNPPRADSDSDRVALAVAFVPLWADWLIYAGIAVCVFLNALLGRVRTDADLVPYLDISDAIRAHLANSVINAYWFPLYPFLLTLARAASGFRPQFELMAARLLDAGIQLLFARTATEQAFDLSVGQETHATAGQEAGATNPLTRLVRNAG
jgi:hypothetical protein